MRRKEDMAHLVSEKVAEPDLNPKAVKISDYFHLGEGSLSTLAELFRPVHKNVIQMIYIQPLSLSFSRNPTASLYLYTPNPSFLAISSTMLQYFCLFLIV